MSTPDSAPINQNTLGDMGHCPGCGTLYDPSAVAPDADRNHVCARCGLWVITGVPISYLTERGRTYAFNASGPRWQRTTGTMPRPEEVATGGTRRGTSVPSSPLSATDLAKLLREQGCRQATDNAVESFLRRYRKKHVDCFICVDDDDRRRNEPKYLYRPEVLPYLLEHVKDPA